MDELNSEVESKKQAGVAKPFTSQGKTGWGQSSEYIVLFGSNA